MSTTSPEDPRGLIDLNARMPVGQSPYGSAYGVSTAARVRPATPNIDAYLLPEADKRVAAKSPMVVARAVPLTKAPVAEFAPPPFEPVVNLEPNQEQLLAMANEQPPPVSGDAGGDTTRYADREAQNQNLEQFRGGDAIVITTGTLIVILLIVILILLLT